MLLDWLSRDRITKSSKPYLYFQPKITNFRLILRKTSKSLRTLVDKLKPACKHLKVSCWDDCILCDYNDQCISYALPAWDHFDFLSTYSDYRLDTVVSKFNYEQVAFDDLALTLNNPKLQLETFEFDSYCDGECCVPFKYKDEGGKINNKYGNMERILKSNNHQLSVKACTIELLSFRSDNPILSHLKPGVLERITIVSAHDKEWSAYSEAMDKVALLEQWKQAKELEVYYGLEEDFPVKHATHFKRFHFVEEFFFPETLILIRDVRMFHNFSKNP